MYSYSAGAVLLAADCLNMKLKLEFESVLVVRSAFLHA